MSDYGDAATQAAELYRSGRANSPNEAWEKATIGIFGKGTSMQLKGCPRDAFLGLCEEGLIKLIPRGQYTRARKNKQYAVDAVALLKQDPSLVDFPAKLWAKVTRGQRKAHNQQMNVVIALWKKNLIHG